VIRAREGNVQQAKAIQQISKKEEARRRWKNIKQALKPSTKSELNTIEIPLCDKYGKATDEPDKAVAWRRITEPSEIENTLLERNIKHFGQAEGTIFTNSEFQETFSYEGTSPAVELLLEAKRNVEAIPNLTNSTRTLLQHLSNTKRLPKMDCSISYEAFAQALRKWSVRLLAVDTSDITSVSLLMMATQKKI
jgi:hypothetical protein